MVLDLLREAMEWNCREEDPPAVMGMVTWNCRRKKIRNLFLREPRMERKEMLFDQ